MKIEITGEPKEIAALVVAIQERQEKTALCKTEPKKFYDESAHERIVKSFLDRSLKL